jgi:hypothetical protein
MTTGELLGEADRLLTTVVPGTRGRWPRACAWLIRLALEQTLDGYWSRVLPQAAECGMRPQLLLLPAYAGGDIAERAREAWMGLARATHHHAYELAPTAAELRGWHRAVSQLVDDLGQATDSPDLESVEPVAGWPGAAAG